MKRSYLISLLLVGIAMSSPSWAVSYTFTELIPLSGAYNSQAFDVNNAGQVVGVSNYAPSCCGGYTKATLWNGTTATELFSYGTSSYAYAINDAGQVAGYEHFKHNSFYEALLWNGGTPAILYTLSGRESTARAINNSGQVAGWSNTSSTTASGTVWNPSAPTIYLGNSSTARAINDAGQVAGNIDSQSVVWNGTTPTYLDSLGGGYSEAQAINNAGQVVGYSLTSSPNATYRATLWNGTTATDLGSLGGLSYANDISDSGQVVGSSYNLDGTSLAVLWNGTTIIDLNSFLDASTVSDGWVLHSAKGINNQGWIVGTAVNTTSQVTSAFLLAPSAVPLPASVWLFGSGLLGLIGMARWKAA